MNIFYYVKISENYFNYFDIYDTNNNKIIINEDENREILLVPEQYKNRETEIYNYFTHYRKEYIEIDTENYNENNRENFMDVVVIPQDDQEKADFNNDIATYFNINVSDDVVIYYIKDDQYLQTFDPELKSTKIKDPIISVFTNNNIIISQTNGNGLYVALDGMTLDEKYNSLTDSLQKYDLIDRYKRLVTLDYTANLYKPIYFESSIVNSILFLIAFLNSLLLVYFFFVKFFNAKIIYIIAIIVILAISNSNYLANIVGSTYLQVTVIYSDKAQLVSNIVIVALFLIIFLCPAFLKRVPNDEVNEKVNK